MRIVVISDSHRRYGVIEKILLEQPKAERVYFLGDVVPDVERAAEHFPDRIFRSVSGNCDFASLLPSTAIDECRGVRILYTHGHTLGVKYGVDRLFDTARENGCRIALFGHTHIALNEYRDGIYLMNPGSCAQSRNGPESYGVIDIEECGILPAILRV